MPTSVSFLDKLRTAIERNRSHFCVGLDPTLEALPEGIDRSPEGVLAFNRTIIEATADFACVFKPNIAFYEALGPDGLRVLGETIRAVPNNIPVIVDAKRGDIGSTAAAYATAIYDRLGADACTVSPYLGFDAIEPFIARPGAFAFVLARTSNPGARDLQDMPIGADGATLYEYVARWIQGRGVHESCGLVVGATDPAGAGRVAAAAPDLWLLAPGLGAQGGDLQETARALGPAAHHTVWSASRAITMAGRGRDYADHARMAARRLYDEINEAIGNQPLAISR